MDIKELRELIDFMNENNLYELEIEEQGKRVKLKKQADGMPIMIKDTAVKAPASEHPASKPTPKENLIEIKSPMVGTFYRAPSPGAKPYTEAGAEIKAGDVVCIIEAMKLMNEIKSEVAGTIVEILAENAEAVEFGQTLFLIKPL